MLEFLPPGLILLAGAVLIMVTRGALRTAVVLGIPLLTLWATWQVPDGVVATMTYLDYSVQFVEGSPVRRLFATIFCIMAFVGGLYAYRTAKGYELAAATLPRVRLDNPEYDGWVDLTLSTTLQIPGRLGTLEPAAVLGLQPVVGARREEVGPRDLQRPPVLAEELLRRHRSVGRAHVLRAQLVHRVARRVPERVTARREAGRRGRWLRR